MVATTTTTALPGHPPWPALLEQQDSVISRGQARRGGMSEDAWQWRLDTGRWRSVLHGVAAAHSGEITERQRSWAAVLFCGHTAHLSADAALAVHGMRLPPPHVLHVVHHPAREVRSQVFRSTGAGQVAHRVEAHRLARLDDSAHPVKQPPVLLPAPAALHAAAWAISDRAAEWRIAAAVQQRVVRVADLRAAVALAPRIVRRGLVLSVLDDVELGAHAASEIAFLRFLRQQRLPLPDTLQRPVRTGTIRYLDAWYARQRVAVEVDGAHHVQVGQWDADVLRGNDVVIAERHDRVLLLRLTMGNLRHDGPRVAAQLRQALL